MANHVIQNLLAYTTDNIYIDRVTCSNSCVNAVETYIIIKRILDKRNSMILCVSLVSLTWCTND